MTIDTKNLRVLAEAAGTNDHNEAREWYDVKYLTGALYFEKNARLVAACSPNVVLALLDALERKDAILKQALGARTYKDRLASHEAITKEIGT